MRLPPRLWLWMIAAALGVAALVGVQALLFRLANPAAFAALPPGFRVQLGVFVALVALSLVPVAAWVVWAVYHRLVVPWHRLREDLEALERGGPDARIELDRVPGAEAIARRLHALAAGGRGGPGGPPGPVPPALPEAAALLERIGAGVVVCEPAGRVLLCNATAREALGLGVGRDIEEALDPQLLVYALDTAREQAAQGVAVPRARFRLAEGEAAAGWIAELAPCMGEGEATALVLTLLPARGETAGEDTYALRAARPAAGPAGDTPLGALRCVVFDTETTGLEPSQGDRIVALGAVVVAQGRVVAEERLERLVRPDRPIRGSAVRVHGITDEMVRHEPTAAEVLPEFARFAAGSVLVAHNAAFDLRFLELAGLAIDQPVLDTMLLSAVVHPHQRSHGLDSLIRRFGVGGEGRHSALGDALMTARVWLCLLPLLAEQGIETLGQAQAASRRVPLARLIY